MKLAFVEGAPSREPAANMTMAVFNVVGETAVTPVTLVLVDVVMPVGTVTSKGFVVLTPENATMAAEILSVLAVKVNEKFAAATSVAVATFDRRVTNPRPLPMAWEERTVQPVGPEEAALVACS